MSLSSKVDAVAAADDEHPNHQLWIDGRCRAVMRLELLVRVGERYRHEHVHPPQQMVPGDSIFEAEETAGPDPAAAALSSSTSAAADQLVSGTTVRGLSQATLGYSRSAQERSG